jgi:hypothetical protein
LIRSAWKALKLLAGYGALRPQRVDLLAQLGDDFLVALLGRHAEQVVEQRQQRASLALDLLVLAGQLADRRIVAGHAYARRNERLLHGAAAHRLAEPERLAERRCIVRPLAGEHAHVGLDNVADPGLRSGAGRSILLIGVERRRQQHLDRLLEFPRGLVGLAGLGETHGDCSAGQGRIEVPFAEAGDHPRKVCLRRLQALGQIAGIVEHVDAAGVHLQIVFPALVPGPSGLIQLPIYVCRLLPTPLHIEEAGKIVQAAHQVVGVGCEFQLAINPVGDARQFSAST